MAKKKKTYDDDDGHVIANMNVEGMPWYRPEKKQKNSQEPLSRKETLQVLWGALGAAMTVALVFAVAGILFVLFCTKVWLR